jgi:hypothetical protein
MVSRYMCYQGIAKETVYSEKYGKLNAFMNNYTYIVSLIDHSCCCSSLVDLSLKSSVHSTMVHPEANC